MALPRRGAAEHRVDLRRRVAHAELEQAVAELLSPLARAHVEAVVAEHVLERREQRGQLEIGEVVVHPLLDGAAAAVVLKEFKGGQPRHRREGTGQTRRAGGLLRCEGPLSVARAL